MTEDKTNPSGCSRSHRVAVLHVGPGCGQRGGMASVMQELQDMGGQFADKGVESAFFETRGFRSLSAIARFFMRDIPQFVLASYSVEVVHFHVAARGSFYRKLILYAIAKLMRRRTVFHLHAGDFDQFLACADRATKRATRWFIGGSDVVIGVSASCAHVLNRFRRNAHDARVIGNTAAAAERDASNALHATCHLRPYIAFAGRLTKQKGVDTLIDALAILAARGCDVDLELAGEGDIAHWRSHAEARNVLDRVRFSGWLDGASKARFYREASIFCLPSQFESFGIVALEAMFHGVPVVATRVGGLPELVVEGVTGHLVAHGSPGVLADAIHGLLRDRERAKRMGAAGRRRAYGSYSVDVIAAEYANCYGEILGMRQRCTR
ncbi:TPA: glycosyltransferase family 4 protein [Burkholderia cenocepacia]|nr:glycosyltransferase family 4 protein [Burkholderia cenocepacia]